jgi:uncharacterized OB-fold protein
MSQADDRGELLSATHVMEYPYRRSVGPVLGRFFTALQEQRIEGSRTAGGRVIVPPSEYDPDTGEATTGMVEVGPAGVVTGWTWVSQPRKTQPLERPFAYALILLDGADVPMLHAVDAGEESRMRNGLRVRPRWREEPEGGITDISCFEPEDA